MDKFTGIKEGGRVYDINHGLGEVTKVVPAPYSEPFFKVMFDKEPPEWATGSWDTVQYNTRGSHVIFGKYTGQGYQDQVTLV